MNSELIVMTFRRRNRAETVLEAIQSMRKSPILCLANAVVAARDATGEIAICRGQDPAAAGEERDMHILLALAHLILRAPTKEAVDATVERGMDARFFLEVAHSIENDSSALFLLARENCVHDAGETRRALALFRGRLHQTSLPPQLEVYLLQGWTSNLAKEESG